MSKLGRKGKYDPESTPLLAEQYAKEGCLDKQIAERLRVRARPRRREPGAEAGDAENCSRLRC